MRLATLVCHRRRSRSPPGDVTAACIDPEYCTRGQEPVVTVSGGVDALARQPSPWLAAGRPSLIAVLLRQGFVALRRRADRWDAAAAGYALVAAICAPLTAPAAVAVLVPGVLLVVLRATRPVRPLPAGGVSAGAAVLWLALIAVGGAWWLVAFLWGNDLEHPTLSLLFDPVLETYPGRVLGYAVWLTAGRWLVSR